jgi:pimeloyl-ACP methyl ester carboxylesterase
MAHWAFRRLSSMLAREGFHVMRFDWSGTGDSWGETVHGTVDGWLEDFSQAAQELRDSSGAESLSIVGMRLGAAIASLAAAKARVADDLVLWDPVVTGAAYIRELESFDAMENMRLLHDVSFPRDELVGFPFPADLRLALGRIDLRRTPPLGARRVSIVGTAPKPEHVELRDAVDGAGSSVSYECVAEEQATAYGVRTEAALLPTRTLNAITARLLEGMPS